MDRWLQAGLTLSHGSLSYSSCSICCTAGYRLSYIYSTQPWLDAHLKSSSPSLLLFIFPMERLTFVKYPGLKGILISLCHVRNDYRLPFQHALVEDIRAGFSFKNLLAVISAHWSDRFQPFCTTWVSYSFAPSAIPTIHPLALPQTLASKSSFLYLSYRVV